MSKQYFAKGKRSIVYLTKIRNKKIIIKQLYSIKQAKKEAKFLKILNQYNIGPKLLKRKNNSLYLEYIKGSRILDYFKISNKKQIKSSILSILKQCYILDKLKINKLELHHPLKHIIINKIPKMIDFERCYYTNKPKNLTQFCQFLLSKKVFSILNKKSIKINKKSFIGLLKVYKKDQSSTNFKKILHLF